MKKLPFPTGTTPVSVSRPRGGSPRGWQVLGTNHHEEMKPVLKAEP